MLFFPKIARIFKQHFTKRFVAQIECMFLGNGIDVQKFDRTNIADDVLEQKRRELRIAPDMQMVGFVGRLVAEKGILELLQAAKSIRQAVPRVHFLDHWAC